LTLPEMFHLKILGHNREDFWEIPEHILGKFLSIIDAGLPQAFGRI